VNLGVGYALREGLRGFRHNRILSFVSVGTIAVSLVVFGIFLIATDHLGGLIDWFRGRVEVRVFLDEEFRVEDAARLKGRITSLVGVEEVVFVTKEKALEELRRDLGEDQDVVDILDENPLPPSFRVTVLDSYQSPRHLNALAEKISILPGVAEIDYGEEWVVRLTKIVRTLIVIDIVLGVIVALSSIFVVSSTMRLAVLARKDVIEIMQLVGATDSLIRSPYLLEGSIQGFLGGGLAALLTFALYRLVIPHLGGVPTARPEIFVLLVVFGALLGLSGSGLSLRRVL
jgi:cell division transport system permease protein